MKSTVFRFVPLFSGLLFGMGMAISGMIEPQKVTGFLDVAGAWDPSLAFVMGGALMVFIPYYFFYINPRTAAMDGSEFCIPETTRIDRKLVLGAAMFGLGWGIAGICPGPAVASLALGNSDIVLFFSAMIIGSVATKAISSLKSKRETPIKAG